jgi:diketogulonate reductase-like aldo/keto reductase
LKPVLTDIAAKISEKTGKSINPAAVLLLWMRAQGVVAVSASGSVERLRWLGEIAKLPQLLSEDDVDKITEVGKTIHFRHYVCFLLHHHDLQLTLLLGGTYGEGLPTSYPTKPVTGYPEGN